MKVKISILILGCSIVNSAQARSDVSVSVAAWDQTLAAYASSFNSSGGGAAPEMIIPVKSGQTVWSQGQIVMINGDIITPYEIISPLDPKMLAEGAPAPFPTISINNTVAASASLPAKWIKTLVLAASLSGENKVSVTITDLKTTDILQARVDKNFGQNGIWWPLVKEAKPQNTLYIIRGFISGKIQAISEHSRNGQLRLLSKICG